MVVVALQKTMQLSLQGFVFGLKRKMNLRGAAVEGDASNAPRGAS